jgi:isopentenyl-diphosphate delta-isomerase
MSEYLILVDENDKEVGRLEKQLVHQLGILHRAFSIFIFNEKGELLLQQRAETKYHSAGLWTNTCCSHPSFGEDLKSAVKRRLYEEMKISCSTSFTFSFTYKAELENGLIENEVDHVFFGISNDLPLPEATEVKDWKYMSMEDVEADLFLQPDKYTQWLKICFPEVKKHFKKLFFEEQKKALCI